MEKYNILFFSCIILFLISLLPILILGEADNPNLSSTKIKENLTKYEISKLQSDLTTIKYNEKADVIIKVKKDKVVIQAKVKNGKIKQVKDSNLIVGEIYGSEIEKLAKEEDVELIEVDQELELLDENIPYGVAFTGAPDVWEDSKGNGIKVAVLDTGIFAHDDLNIAGGTSIVSEDYNDNNGHGTAVAGVISALINEEGLIGVSPDVNLYAVKIMNSSVGQLSDAIDGVDWAIKNNMNIISMSFGYNAYSQIFKEKLEEAYENNILLISAAGNNGGDVVYPAKYSTVIAVGATDENNQTASFSAHGYELELVASGVDINTTTNANDYGLFSGTSLSAPHVTGVAALIWSYNTNLTNEELRAKLANDAIDLGEEGKDDYFGYGLVHVDLTKWNTQPSNQSYDYWVYNVSDYGEENQSEEFWLERYGTIDDVVFLSGYYHTFRNFGGENVSEYIRVDENGEIISLTITYDWDDDYTYEGSSTDAKGWVNSNLFKVRIVPYNHDVACYNRENDDLWDADDRCYADSSADMNNCKAKDSNLNTFCTNFPSYCSTAGVGTWASIPNSKLSEPRQDSIDGRNYSNCAGSTAYINTLSQGYKVFSKKKAVCSGGANFNIDAYYGMGCGGEGGPCWYTFASAHSCNATANCDPTKNELYEATTATYSFATGPYTPCRQADGQSCGSDSDCVTGHYCNQGICGAEKIYYCDGKFEVNVEDSQNSGMANIYVHVNGKLNGTTNIIGQKTIIFDNVQCGENAVVRVNCTNTPYIICNERTTSIDYDDDIDVINFNCNKCYDQTDMYISLSDVNIKYNGSDSFPLRHNITLEVHSENVNANNVKVSFYGINDKTGLIDGNESVNTTVSFASSDNLKSVSVLMNLSDIHYIQIYVDPDNMVQEPKDNNFVVRPFFLNPYGKNNEYYNIIVNTGNKYADQAIYNYLTYFIPNGSMSGAYQNYIIVGNPTTNPQAEYINKVTLDNDEWGYNKEAETILFNNNPVGNQPYIGLVGYKWALDGNRYIVIYGNDIEGIIAGVRRLISSGNLFLNAISQKVTIIDKYDLTGISTFDLLHNNESGTYFLDKNNNFTNVVGKVLMGNNYDISIRPVQTTDNTSYGQKTILRLKHANSDFTGNYKDAVVNNSKPVVLGHGFWSDLTGMEWLGSKLITSSQPRDVWLIEYHGGPTTECDNCPDYTYNDQVNYYWPTLIAGVEQYSGQNSLDYVGYSHGARLGLDSLNKYQSGKNNIGYYFDYDTGNWMIMDLASQPINHFISIVAPGALNGSSGGIDMFKDHMDEAIAKVKAEGKNHTDSKELTKEMPIECLTGSSSLKSVLYCLGYWLESKKGSSGNKMSTNLLENYHYLALNISDSQPGDNITINKFTLIDGNEVTYGKWNPYADGLNDDLVPTSDGDNIFKNINSTDKTHYRMGQHHTEVLYGPIAYKMIFNRLNNLPEEEEGVHKID